MSSTKITRDRLAGAAVTEHPRMRLEHRVPLAAAFALAHAGEGFTIPMLAAALDCSNDVAGYTRAELERQLADTPIQLRDMSRASLQPRQGWLATDEDHHHDRHLYRLTPR
jgi:hypothetical protein